MAKHKRKSESPAEIVARGLARSGYLTTAQAAALMGISPRTFGTLIQEGEIECCAEFGNAHLFRAEDVLRARRRLYGY